jgi:hypothetical protein
VTSDELKGHIDVIEESYEFFLAYAAQGVSGGSGISGELSDYLRRTHETLGALEGGLGDLTGVPDPDGAFGSMGEVMQRDARDTRAAVGLTMAQSAISSQLIDNLNASIHFRALLTDLFLIDEALKTTLASVS